MILRGVLRLILLILIAYCSLAMPGEALAVGSARCAIDGPSLWMPPNEGGAPVVVEVEIFLIDLQEISDVQSNYTVDFGLTLSWTDPRIQAMVEEGEGCSAALPEIWHPAFIFLNASESGMDHVGEVDVRKSGEVVYSRRYTRTFNTKLKLQPFPFDKQKLPITIASSIYSPDEVVFVTDQKLIEVWEGAQLPGWKLNSLVADESVNPITKMGTRHSAIAFNILVERKAEFYLWRLVLPLFLVILMAWAVFWLDPVQIAPQVTLATGSIFSLMSLLIGQTQMLPRLPYMTIADILIVISLLLVFSAFGEAIFTGTLSFSGKVDKAKRVDRIGRRVYISIVAVVLMLVAILYLG